MGPRAGANIHVYVGGDGKPPGSRGCAAEHCKELGKEKLIVTLCCDATISDNCSSCKHARRLALLKSHKQVVERTVFPDRTYLLRLDHVWMRGDSILTG